jgi:hypothetical protein
VCASLCFYPICTLRFRPNNAMKRRPSLHWKFSSSRIGNIRYSNTAYVSGASIEHCGVIGTIQNLQNARTRAYRSGPRSKTANPSLSTTPQSGNCCSQYDYRSNSKPTTLHNVRPGLSTRVKGEGGKSRGASCSFLAASREAWLQKRIARIVVVGDCLHGSASC